MLLEKLGAVCKAAPERTAVVAGAERLSYGELQQRATALASILRDTGITRGSLVAIYTRRTADTIAGLVGIMISGAAYTIVEDDGHQVEHHNRLKTINPDLVLCEATHVSTLRVLGLRAMALEAMQHREGCGDFPPAEVSQVAYVLFTSGSTGKPKGVAVTHANVAHYTTSITEFLAIKTPMRYAHVSTLAADLGNTSLFLSLSTGGCLHLVSAELRKEPRGLRDYLIRHEIEFVKITPSHWNAIFTDQTTQSGHASSDDSTTLRLRYLVLGGEVLPTSLARRILQSQASQVLVNHYGPTETTVGVIAHPLVTLEQVEAITSDSIPLGRPFGETTLHVRSEDGSFRNKSVTGELYIGGPSVAAGYVGDPVATANSFVAIGVDGMPEQRYYKTGDVVSIDEGGIVSFLGRVDRQVKVNGYRVELEHIERVIRTCTDIVDAAAFFVEVRGRGRLVAAVLARDVIDPVRLKDQLEATLPTYMMPRTFLQFAAFPRNDNGKTDLKVLQTAVLARLQDETSTEPSRSAAVHPDSALVEEVRAVWRTYLQDRPFGDDDSFFALGADSLDAIQLIADLQAQGYCVSANSFLKNPTVRGLVAGMTNPEQPMLPTRTKRLPSESRSFSAAQDFFLRQSLAQPDHYNQAVLLECGESVSVEAMTKAIADLVAHHPMLRAAYGQDAHGWFSRLREHDATALGLSVVSSEASLNSMQRHIDEVAQHIQGSLSLANGQLFQAHLFKCDSQADQLLLVAHHMAVDVISWRILIAELTRRYSDYCSGESPVMPENSTTFWDWIEHIDGHAEALYRRASKWLGVIASKGHDRLAPAPSNTEGSAQTVWLGFSAEETRFLARNLVTALNTPLHLILLAALAHSIGCRAQCAEVAVDVESHGRLTFDDTIDVSRVVGWHTSTFPIFVDVSARQLRPTIASLVRAMHNVPDLGIAYGVVEKSTRRQLPSEPSARICFNYIGEIAFSHDPRFAVSPSHYAFGRARGDTNARGHELKFTARLMAGQLVADLSFPRSADLESMQGLMRSIKHELFGLLGREAAPAHLVEEDGTKGGLITYCPAPLVARTRQQGRRQYEAVLLTGATGYVGVYVLQELLRQSNAHLYCVVRAVDAQPARERLRDAFDWYFPSDPFHGYNKRITVLTGDVSLDMFGLQEHEYECLNSAVDAVYHFAADTRLFGPEEEFERHNVRSVKQCIHFATQGRPKDLHYMSTLAVSGVNPGDEAVTFDESSLNIGQEFQNFYEATKYTAELLVRQFHTQEGRGFIYRSGNISGHSSTAGFQRNAMENRLVQLLLACAKVGAVPLDLGEALVLSPVDKVAQGIVAISLDRATQGGVFHVESSYAIPAEKLFGAMQENGIALVQSRHPSFAHLFMAVRDQEDLDTALAYFWATRRPRNVRYNHSKTQALLRHLGCSFQELDDLWLSSFIRALGERGVFDPTPISA